MTLTVAEVLELPVVRSGEPEVLSGRRLTERIRWAHSSDLADLSSLLQGGELVLTTGTALARKPRKYLSGLAKAGAVGVIVELGTVISELPDNTGRIADELDIALVALHRKTRFVEVTEAVHRRIVAAQYEEVAFDRHVHETFTELSMKGAPLTGIVDAAAKILDEPVVLEDLSHKALVVSTGTPADLLAEWEMRSRRSPGKRSDSEPWLATGVGPRSQQWGRLVIPRRAADAGRATMVLERAAAALAMRRMVERDKTGLQQQAQGGLIDDVLRGRISDDRDAAARAHALGLRHSAHYLPAVVRVPGPTAFGDPVAAHRRNVVLLDAVAHTVNAAGHSGLFSIRGDGEVAAVLALREHRAPAADKTLAALGERIRREVHRIDGAEGTVLALGPAARSVTDTIAGLSEATDIAEVAMAMEDDRPYYRASDVRLRGLISLLRDDRRVQRFAETELRSLLTDTPQSEPTHLTVLREYLRLAGNKAAVADRLHVSRPFVYKRLTEIRELLGVDLDDGESMTSLHVALLVHEASRQRA